MPFPFVHIICLRLKISGCISLFLFSKIWKNKSIHCFYLVKYEKTNQFWSLNGPHLKFVIFPIARNQLELIPLHMCPSKSEITVAQLPVLNIKVAAINRNPPNPVWKVPLLIFLWVFLFSLCFTKKIATKKDQVLVINGRSTASGFQSHQKEQSPPTIRMPFVGCGSELQRRWILTSKSKPTLSGTSTSEWPPAEQIYGRFRLWILVASAD